MVTTMISVWWLVAVFSITPSLAGNNSLTPNGTNCVCPDMPLTYTCNILGGGATVWRGTTLSCVGSDVTVRHDSDNFQPGTFPLCDGTIIREIVGIEGDDCHITRLNFTATNQFNNTVTECLVQDPEVTSVGSSTIFIIPVPYYLQEPSGVNMTKVNMTEITFNWMAVNSDCPRSPINYIVTSPNCSDVTCTNSTRNESTCSNLPVASTCAFSISSEVCGQTETVNNAITVTLRRPRTSITPVYSDDSPSILTKVLINIYREPFVSVAGNVSSPVTGYRLSNSDRSIAACEENEVMCQRSVDAATFACRSSTDIVVSLSALNIMLGRGPSSDPTTLGCINEFVSVQFDSATSTITCNFLEEMDTSIKSCSAMYGQQCDEMLVPGPQQNSTVEAPNSIALVVDSETYSCYLVTASNDSLSIIVEVRASMGSGSTRAGVIIGIVFGVIGVILTIAISLVVFVIILVVVVKPKKKRRPLNSGKGVGSDQPLWGEFTLDEEFNRTQTEAGANKIVKQFELEEVPQDDIKLINIHRRCKLKELTEDIKSVTKIKIDCSFCEFKGELENVSEEKEIIFFDKEKRMFYTSNISLLKKKRNFSDRRKSLQELFNPYYEIFVESTESDEEDLEQGTSVLYKVLKTETPVKETTDDNTDSKTPAKGVGTKVLKTETPVKETTNDNTDSETPGKGVGTKYTTETPGKGTATDDTPETPAKGTMAETS